MPLRFFSSLFSLSHTFFLVCFLSPIVVFEVSLSLLLYLSANRLHLLSPPLSVWTLDLLSWLHGGPGLTLGGFFDPQEHE